MENFNSISGTITIQSWMVNRLGLKSNELFVYALIHGFSQDGKSYFAGSEEYIMENTNISKQDVQSALKSLEQKKLIVKNVKVSTTHGVKSCEYFTVESRVRVSQNAKQKNANTVDTSKSAGFTTYQNSGKQSLPPQSTQFT